ncbi:MAG: tRNA (adenosine(37)-N6)-dimethylallyltransferase MiaA [Collinsella sp.]|nr:tRNA (adenosine(37)-N6)-dimethylallyltransferase MiaA [Collinsella sp.]
MTKGVIAITGPTASGKSALADQVALALGSEVISADAMQVYRGMDIGTAKTPVAERLVPLLLVDIVDPADAYSAALFQRDARREIDRLLEKGQVPILCGGTGLYLRAALDEMDFPSGQIDDGRRQRFQELADALGPEGLHRRLAELDPPSAQAIHPNNVRRVIRALEMLDEGVSYADQKAGFSRPSARYPQVTFALTMDRERLYRRIDERVDRMIADGLVKEVEGLVSQGAGEAITSRQAIGYKEIIDALEGRCSLDEAIELIKMRSRRYAKRQLSWSRRDPRTIWIDMDEMDLEEAVAFVLSESEVVR